MGTIINKTDMAFNKQVINRNTDKADKAKVDIIKLVDMLNKYSNYFIDKDAAYLEEIKYNSREVQTNEYQNKLKEICLNFGLDYDEAKYKFANSKYDMVKEMASNKTTELRKAITEIHSFLYWLPIEVVSITITKQDDKFVLVNGYEDIINEYFTDYTQNVRQNEVVTKFHQLIKLYEELESLGVNRYDILNCYLYSNGTIDAKQIYKNIN